MAVERARRSCLSVPGASPKMLAKAPSLPADEVFCDLEDSVAPGMKEAARQNIVAALRDGDWSGKTTVVRVNGVATKWCYRDIIDVVSAAGGHIDCVMVPKVESAGEIEFVAHLLRMVEDDAGLAHRLGIEAQIESAAGLENIKQIARACDRVETLVFGPADMSASLGLPTMTIGDTASGYPGDQWHWVLETILVTARAAGLQAIDGPYGRIHDLAGYKESANRSASLGYDGKWALHPGQITVANEVFTPGQEEFDRASAMLEAYEHATGTDMLGAVTFGAEMIDEATRKMAHRLLARGRAAGLSPHKTWADFQAEWQRD